MQDDINQEIINKIMKEWQEMINSAQMKMHEFYRTETNFLNNLPRELVNTIVERQNETAR